MLICSLADIVRNWVSLYANKYVSNRSNPRDDLARRRKYLDLEITTIGIAVVYSP